MEITTIKIPLILEEWERVGINQRMIAHGMLYNAVLSELLKRINAYHANPISTLPYSRTNYKKKNELKSKLGISKYYANKIAAKAWRDSNNHLLDSATCNTTAERAWISCMPYLAKQKGKPTYKLPQRNSTVEGQGMKKNLRLALKSPYASKRKSEMRLKPLLSRPIEDTSEIVLSWANRKLSKHRQLKLILDWQDLSNPRREWVLTNLNNVRCVSITKELIRGEWKYYACIMIRVKAYRKEEYLKTGRSMGIDTGPWRSHGVDDRGECQEFTPSKQEIDEYDSLQNRIAKKSRKIERSRRANPAYKENYNDDGTNKMGAYFDPELLSNNAKALEKDLIELNRKRAALRKVSVQKQVKEIALGYDTVVVEQVSYQAWKTRYGKAMQLHTPGAFQNLLNAELTRHDKKLIKLPLKYAFSQVCICGNKVKKEQNDRIHRCPNNKCLIYNQDYHRDQFSAFLMRMVYTKRLTIEELHNGKLMESLKRIGLSSNDENTTVEVFLPPRLNDPRSEAVQDTRSSLTQDARVYSKSEKSRQDTFASCELLL